MNATRTSIEISQDDLVAHLADIDRLADGDLVRIVELLLVENAALRLQTSAGLLRGVRMQVETYPRFLELVDRDTDVTEVANTMQPDAGAGNVDGVDQTVPDTKAGHGPECGDPAQRARSAFRAS